MTSLPWPVFCICGANVVCKFGTWLSFVAAMILVYQFLPDGLSLAWLIVFRRLPAVCFHFAGGRLADRYDPKWVVIGSSTVMLCITLALYALDYLNGGFYIPILVSFTLISCLEGLYKPALQAFVYQLCSCEQMLERANTLINSSGMLTVLLAGILSPFFAKCLGLSTLLIVCAIAYIVALAVFLAVFPKYHRHRFRTLGIEILLQMRPRAVAALQMNSLLAVFYAFITLAVIEYPVAIYRCTYWGTSVMNTAIGAGVLAAAVLYAIKSGTPRRIRNTMGRFCLGLGLAFLLFALNRSLVPAAFFLATAMLFFGYLKILSENVFFLGSKSGSIGRSFSLLYIIEELIIAGTSIALSLLAGYSSLFAVGICLGSALLALTFAAASQSLQPWFSYAAGLTRLGLERGLRSSANFSRDRAAKVLAQHARPELVSATSTGSVAFDEANRNGSISSLPNIMQSIRSHRASSVAETSSRLPPRI